MRGRVSATLLLSAAAALTFAQVPKAPAQLSVSSVAPLAITSITSGNGLGRLDASRDINDVPTAANRLYADTAVNAWPSAVAFPPAYAGLHQILTRAADATTTGGTTVVSFTISAPAYVCVIHDDRIASKPAWLTSSYTNQGDDFLIAQGLLGSRYCTPAPVAAGTVNLGGNCASSCSNVAMYVPFLIPSWRPLWFALTHIPTAPVLGTPIAQDDDTLLIPLEAACSLGDGTLTIVLQRSPAGAENWTQIDAGTQDGVFDTDGKMVDRPLSPSTSYDYRALCVDQTPDSSPHSPNVTGTTGATPPSDTTAPSAPGTPTTSSITSSSITWSWTAATDNVAVTQYNVYCGDGDGSGNPVSGTSVLTVRMVPNITLTGLNPNTQKYCRASAQDAAGNVGALTSRVFATTSGSTPSLLLTLDDWGSIPTNAAINQSSTIYPYDTDHLGSSGTPGVDIGGWTGDFWTNGTNPRVILHPVTNSRAMSFAVLDNDANNDGLTDSQASLGYDPRIAFRSEISFGGPTAGQVQTGWQGTRHWIGWDVYLTMGTRSPTCYGVSPCPFVSVIIGQLHGIRGGNSPVDDGFQNSPAWALTMEPEGNYRFYTRGDVPSLGAQLEDDLGAYAGDLGTVVRWAMDVTYHPTNGSITIYKNCSIVAQHTGVRTYSANDTHGGYYKWGLYSACGRADGTVHNNPCPAFGAVYDNIRVGGSGSSLSAVSPTC